MAPYEYPYNHDFSGGVLYRFLSKAEDQGQELNDISMIGDYSSAEQEFCIHPEDDEVLAVYKITVDVRDEGKFDSGSYGNGITLTNGIKLQIRFDGIEVDVVPLTIKINPDWSRYCFDINLSNYGTGDETLNAKWDFASAGSPLWLAGKNVHPSNLTSRLCAVLNDDFTGLKDHTILCHGLKWTTK